MAIRWSDSAAKHGIEEADASHAMQNYLYRVEKFDEPRIEGGQRMDLFIGPSRNRRMMLEVMAILTPGRHSDLPRDGGPAGRSSILRKMRQ